MSNSIAMQDAQVRFTKQEMDIAAFKALLDEGERAYQASKGAGFPFSESFKSKVPDMTHGLADFLEAVHDMATFFARANGDALIIDFYPEGYEGDVTYRSLRYIINNLIHPFIRTHKTHVFQIADLEQSLFEDDAPWEKVQMDFMEKC